jgi:hypothetical protein
MHLCLNLVATTLALHLSQLQFGIATANRYSSYFDLTDCIRYFSFLVGLPVVTPYACNVATSGKPKFAGSCNIYAEEQLATTFREPP